MSGQSAPPPVADLLQLRRSLHEVGSADPPTAAGALAALRALFGDGANRGMLAAMRDRLFLALAEHGTHAAERARGALAVALGEADAAARAEEALAALVRDPGGGAHLWGFLEEVLPSCADARRCVPALLQLLNAAPEQAARALAALPPAAAPSEEEFARAADAAVRAGADAVRALGPALWRTHAHAAMRAVWQLAERLRGAEVGGVLDTLLALAEVAPRVDASVRADVRSALEAAVTRVTLRPAWVRAANLVVARMRLAPDAAFFRAQLDACCFDDALRTALHAVAESVGDKDEDEDEAERRRRAARAAAELCADARLARLDLWRHLDGAEEEAKEEEAKEEEAKEEEAKKGILAGAAERTVLLEAPLARSVQDGAQFEACLDAALRDKLPAGLFMTVLASGVTTDVRVLDAAAAAPAFAVEAVLNECAKFVVAARLKTPFGGPKETLNRLGEMLKHDCASSDPAKLSFVLRFVTGVERHTLRAERGAFGDACRTFYHANRANMHVFFGRIRWLLINAAHFVANAGVGGVGAAAVAFDQAQRVMMAVYETNALMAVATLAHLRDPEAVYHANTYIAAASLVRLRDPAAVAAVGVHPALLRGLVLEAEGRPAAAAKAYDEALRSGAIDEAGPLARRAAAKRLADCLLGLRDWAAVEAWCADGARDPPFPYSAEALAALRGLGDWSAPARVFEAEPLVGVADLDYSPFRLPVRPDAGACVELPDGALPAFALEMQHEEKKKEDEEEKEAVASSFWRLPVRARARAGGDDGDMRDGALVDGLAKAAQLFAVVDAADEAKSPPQPPPLPPLPPPPAAATAADEDGDEHGVLASVVARRPCPTAVWVVLRAQSQLAPLVLLKLLTDGEEAAAVTAADEEQIVARAVPEAWASVVPQLFSRLGHASGRVRAVLVRLLECAAEAAPFEVLFSLLSARRAAAVPRRKRAALAALAATARVRELLVELEPVAEALLQLGMIAEDRWLALFRMVRADMPGRLAMLQEEYALLERERDEQRRDAARAQRYAEVLAPVLQSVRELPAVPAADKEARALVATLEGGAADPKAMWEAAQERMTAIAAVVDQQGAQLRLADVSPLLAAHRASRLAIPGMPAGVTIERFVDTVERLRTKTRPKRLTLVGSDGCEHAFLLKSREDLRLDQRVMQVLDAANAMLLRGGARAPGLRARTYPVVPLSARVGLLRWVPRTEPLFEAFRAWRKRDPIAAPQLVFSATLAKELQARELPEDLPRRKWPADLARAVFDRLAAAAGPVRFLVRNELWVASLSAEDWWVKTVTFQRSYATMCALGHVVGLGDRHLGNILLDARSGEVLHIDYHISLEKGLALSIPERVPFRLTAAIRGVCDDSHAFTTAMAHVLRVVQRGPNADTLLLLLEALLYDPIFDWTSSRSSKSDSAAALNCALVYRLLRERLEAGLPDARGAHEAKQVALLELEYGMEALKALSVAARAVRGSKQGEDDGEAEEDDDEEDETGAVPSVAALLAQLVEARDKAQQVVERLREEEAVHARVVEQHWTALVAQEAHLSSVAAQHGSVLRDVLGGLIPAGLGAVGVGPEGLPDAAFALFRHWRDEPEAWPPSGYVEGLAQLAGAVVLEEAWARASADYEHESCAWLREFRAALAVLVRYRRALSCVDVEEYAATTWAAARAAEIRDVLAAPNAQCAALRRLRERCSLPDTACVPRHLVAALSAPDNVDAGDKAPLLEALKHLASPELALAHGEEPPAGGVAAAARDVRASEVAFREACAALGDGLAQVEQTLAGGAAQAAATSRARVACLMHVASARGGSAEELDAFLRLVEHWRPRDTPVQALDALLLRLRTVGAIERDIEPAWRAHIAAIETAPVVEGGGDDDGGGGDKPNLPLAFDDSSTVGAQLQTLAGKVRKLYDDVARLRAGASGSGGAASAAKNGAAAAAATAAPKPSFSEAMKQSEREKQRTARLATLSGYILKLQSAFTTECAKPNPFPSGSGAHRAFALVQAFLCFIADVHARLTGEDDDEKQSMWSRTLFVSALEGAAAATTNTPERASRAWDAFARAVATAEVRPFATALLRSAADAYAAVLVRHWRAAPDAPFEHAVGGPAAPIVRGCLEAARRVYEADVGGARAALRLEAAEASAERSRVRHAEALEEALRAAVAREWLHVLPPAEAAGPLVSRVEVMAELHARMSALSAASEAFSAFDARVVAAVEDDIVGRVGDERALLEAHARVTQRRATQRQAFALASQVLALGNAVLLVESDRLRAPVAERGEETKAEATRDAYVYEAQQREGDAAALVAAAPLVEAEALRRGASDELEAEQHARLWTEVHGDVSGGRIDEAVARARERVARACQELQRAADREQPFLGYVRSLAGSFAKYRARGAARAGSLKRELGVLHSCVRSVLAAPSLRTWRRLPTRSLARRDRRALRLMEDVLAELAASDGKEEEEEEDEEEAPNERAARAVERVRAKLCDAEGSVEDQVARLVAEATDPDRLCQLYEGWAAWL